MSRKIQKGLNAYAMFHGKRPKTIKEATFNVPNTLILLGDGISIVYACSKRNGGGDGTPAEYIHKFGAGVKVYMDEKKRSLYIFGGKMKVSARGIEN